MPAATWSRIMTNQSAILAEDAARLPLALRRIARAFLDRAHLSAAAGVPADCAAQTVANARWAVVLVDLVDGYTTDDGSIVPGTATVRDAAGRSWMRLYYRDAQVPTVEAFGADGESLGVAHLGAQFPLLDGETD
jgi:hypothetical protein